MALGAGQRDVLEMVLRDPILVLAVGAAVALTVTRAVANLLFWVAALDPAAVLLAAAVVVTFVAAFVPAYRAARTDPTVALRYEYGG